MNDRTEVATRQESPVAQLQHMLGSRAAEIQAALPDHISPDKFNRTVVTAATQNPDLLKADRGSLILSAYKCAQDGLLPDGREAAFVTFKENKKTEDGWQSKTVVQYIPMVYGLRKKILQSFEVSSLEVGVVYEKELVDGAFFYEVGMNPPLRHRPSFGLKPEDTTDDKIVAAYSIATMKDGSKSYEVMRRFEIDRVRQTSQTGALGKTVKFGKDKGKEIPPKGPWVDWFAEMAKKTVMRRHAKTLPMSGDLLVDVEGREAESAFKSALVLDSQAPDAPVAIEDRSEDLPAHDAETGELASDEQVDQANRAGLAEGERTVGDDLTREGAAETRQDAPEASDASSDAEAASDPPADATGGAAGEPEAEEETAATDETDEAMTRAGEIINEILGANSIMDVNSIYSRHKKAVEALPPEIGAKVDIAADQHKKALKDRNDAEKAAGRDK
jgi:recombination protein RecT